MLLMILEKQYKLLMDLIVKYSYFHVIFLWIFGASQYLAFIDSFLYTNSKDNHMPVNDLIQKEFFSTTDKS